MVKWLAQNLVHSVIKALLYVFSFCMASHGSYNRLAVQVSPLGRHKVLPYLPTALVSIHKGHITVHQNQGVAAVDVVWVKSLSHYTT